MSKRGKRACSANPLGLLRRKSRCDSVAEIRADVSATHDGSQERQDAQLLASGALGASWPPSGAGDGGAAGRARWAGGVARAGALALRITGQEEQYELFEAPAGRSETVAVRMDPDSSGARPPFWRGAAGLAAVAGPRSRSFLRGVILFATGTAAMSRRVGLFETARPVCGDWPCSAR